MAKKRTASKPSRPPISPSPMMGRVQSSGMMKPGDMMMKPPAVIASIMQSAGGKRAGKKGRRK